MPARRVIVRTVATVVSLLFVLIGYVLFPWPMPPARSFEVVAHRGVHQTFPLSNLTNETCTAEIIHPPAHGFIENTIPSMRAAFEHGATAVELDIHRTADDHLVVFHDWTLACRTNGAGVTNEQTLASLKGLDVGYGYTADGGQTFPFRGKGVGLIPSLLEVLAEFPNRQFVIHDKDGDARTRSLLVETLRNVPASQRARLFYWGDEFAALHEQLPEMQPYLYDRHDLLACRGDLLVRMLLLGNLPASCRQQIIGIPIRILPSIPGWPNLILARAYQAGAKVVVTDVDTADQLETVRDLPLDGIQTNRIEVIGPLIEAGETARQPNSAVSHGVGSRTDNILPPPASVLSPDHRERSEQSPYHPSVADSR